MPSLFEVEPLRAMNLRTRDVLVVRMSRSDAFGRGRIMPTASWRPGPHFHRTVEGVSMLCAGQGAPSHGRLSRDLLSGRIGTGGLQ